MRLVVDTNVLVSAFLWQGCGESQVDERADRVALIAPETDKMAAVFIIQQVLTL